MDATQGGMDATVGNDAVAGMDAVATDMGPPDSGDFADFVKHLIDTQTMDNNLPATLPMPDLPDQQSQAEYQSYFP
jgi:hypothetical protein